MAESQNSKQNVQAPQAGQTVIVNAIPGQDIVLEAAFDQAEVKMDGGNVVFEFANGGQVVLDFTDLGEAQAPNVVMPDGTILDMQEFLAAMGEKDVEPAAGPDGGATGSGGVGEYQDDAGDVIGGTDKLGGFDPRGFSTVVVEGLEASNSIPILLGPDGVLVEDEAIFPEGNNEDEGGVGVISGTIVDNVDWGADGFGGVNGFTVGGASFSAGSTVFWGQDGTFLGTSGVGGAASLLVNADGTYDFGLIDNMLLGQGVQGEQIDVLSTVQIIGADSNGDTVDVPLTLRVQDDVPVLLGENPRPDEPADNDVPDYDGDEPVIFAARAAQPAPGENGNTLVNGLGGERGFGENFLEANDDGSVAVDVSSVFPDGMNFFGTVYNQIYINNNGNITFAAPLSAYTPSAITGTTSNPMIAPFFADVDTMGAAGNVSSGGTSMGSNLVWYDLDSANGVLTVTWDDVGYYDANSDKVNAFQLRIFDQGDGNFSFEFRYENVDWTTGDVSGGSGGLGGTVARAGWTAGDGENFFELSQSGNQAGMLDLEATSNPSTAIDGNWVFNVIGGVISTGEGADIAMVEDESIPDSIGGITNELDDNGVGSFVQNIRDNVSWGADGFGKVVEFYVQSEPESGPFAAGEKVYWAQNGSFMGAATEAPEGAAAYLLVKVDGDYEFTLIDNMLMGNDPQIPLEQIDFLDTVEIVGADADGDTVTVNVTLNVQDDVPVALVEASETATVDEDDIETTWSLGTSSQDGNADLSFTGGFDPETAGPAIVQGSVASLVDFGADDMGENGFSLSTNVAALEDQGLTSNGDDLDYHVSGNTLVALVGQWSEADGFLESLLSGDVRDARPVFTLELQSNGEYTFRLYDQLDHDHDSEVYDESLPIDLSAMLIATDGDGDAVEFVEDAFVINVTDDVPVFTESGDIVVNGSFETPDVQSWGTYTNIDGWSADSGTRIEIQNSGVGGVGAQHGSQLLEMDSYSNATVTQTIQTAGHQNLVLSFWFASRAHGNIAETNTVDVYWGDSKIATITDAVAGRWTQYSFEVEGDASSVDLKFVGAGTNDSYGGLIDNVSVYSMPTVDEFGLRPDGVGALLFASASLPVDFGADGPGEVSSLTLANTSTIKSAGNVVSLEYSEEDDAWYGVADGDNVFKVDVNLAEGEYTFELLNQLDHGLGSDLMKLDFGFTVTDGDGDPVNGTFSVGVFDDEPTANPDFDSPTPFEANLLANDEIGADQTGHVLTVDGVTPDAEGNIVVHGHYGDLTVNTDGDYDYDSYGLQNITLTNAGHDSAGYKNTFGYFIVDDNGDPTGDGHIIWANTNTLVDPSGNEPYTIANVHPDNVAWFLIPNGGVHNASVTGFEDGAAVNIVKNSGGDWVVQLDTGETLHGENGETALFGGDSGGSFNGSDHYTYLTDNDVAGNLNWEDIPGGGDNDHDDVNINMNVADAPIHEQFTYTMSDYDGDQSSSTLTISSTVEDDAQHIINATQQIV